MSSAKIHSVPFSRNRLQSYNFFLKYTNFLSFYSFFVEKSYYLFAFSIRSRTGFESTSSQHRANFERLSSVNTFLLSGSSNNFSGKNN